MTAKRSRRLRLSSLAVMLTLGAAAPAAAQQLTTGSIRGRVVSEGQPVELAEVTAVNQERGVTFRATTGTDGRYEFVALPVGPYTVTVRRIGFRPVERRDVAVHLGETVQINFTLTPAAAELEAIDVTAEAQPLIDSDQSGYVDLVNARQVEAIPVNGRNFADLVALSPSVQLDVGDGSGGNLSLGGGRRGATLIQIDGAGATGTFFGGEARGSDRIPFAYSIESVREFQVVTNAYDVEYGFFSGGLINAVTKSGTNQLQGSLFGFFRDDAFTGNDFFGFEPTEFKSRQIGGTLSGPLVRDRLHFFLAVERQDRDEPVFGVPAPGSAPDPSSDVHPDSIARFLDILQSEYGVEDRAGRFTQNQDEWSVFARLDWQLSDRHRLTLRHNYTDLNQQGDRISRNETFLNGGVFLNTGNSTVANLTSVLGPTVTNDFRAQLAFEPRPREANTLVPELEVDIRSDFGTETTFTDVECCNDPVLPNNLEETTFELANNVHIRAGSHSLKIGGQFNYFDYENFFFFQQQGQFEFDDLDDFENGRWSRFERNLPNPGPDGQFFTDDDAAPLALYQTMEYSFYAQDSWDVTDRLNVLLGARFDITRFPDAAPLNDDLLASDLGLRSDVKPSDENISPRFGITYKLDDQGSTVLRGGAGLFYGRFPSVLYSNSLLNTGLTGGIINCFFDASLDPKQVVRDYAASITPDNPQGDRTIIPTECPGGGFAFTPRVNVFDPTFELPQTVKANVGIAHALTGALKLELDFVYGRTTDNFYVEERNLLDEQFRADIEDRPVFAPLGDMRSSGRFSFASNRVDPSFDQVLSHVSTAEGRNYQVSFELSQRWNGRFAWQFGYTYSNSKDNSSYSCCISSTALFETPTAGDPNFLGEPGDELTGSWGPSDFDRRHTFVASGQVALPLGFEVAGIWRLTSGRPWTPTIGDDANADGFRGNDRAYIGTDLVFETPEDEQLMAGFIAEHECLAEQQGRIASRNSCRQPWFNRLDLRLRKTFGLAGTHRVELVGDFFNVLNLINDEWGRNVGVAGGNQTLLFIEGFDAGTQAFTYAVNDSFGQESDLTPFRTDQFQMQLGARYRF